MTLSAGVSDGGVTADPAYGSCWEASSMVQHLLNPWDLCALCMWNPRWRPQGSLLSRDWEQLGLKFDIVSFSIRN